MNIQMAVDVAKIALELKKPFVVIERGALELLVESAQYDPELRYVPIPGVEYSNDRMRLKQLQESEKKRLGLDKPLDFPEEF